MLNPEPGDLSIQQRTDPGTFPWLLPIPNPLSLSRRDTVSPCQAHGDICGYVLDECYSVITSDPRKIPSPCLTETPSPGFMVMGDITLSPFCLPVPTPAFTFGAANLMIQQPPALHSKICEVLSDRGTPQKPRFSICPQTGPCTRANPRANPGRAAAGLCPEPSPAGSRQLRNEA